MNSDEYELRPLTPEDKPEFANTVYTSFNTWHARHGGQGDFFPQGPHITEIFFDVYNEISPGYSVAAFKPGNPNVLGSCFYHPRKHHVSLGIMSVHPDHFGQGIGKALVQHIIDFTESNGYDSLRLIGSAANNDSFSLYNKADFVPRCAYQDMLVPVPETGLPNSPQRNRLRTATPNDASAMAALEMEISEISRQPDFEYCIANRLGCFTTYILEGQNGTIQGFAIALKSPALNIIGPLLARTEENAIDIITKALDDFKGLSPLIVVPMEKRRIVRKLYDYGARNVETHLCQVRGAFKPFQGISLPSYLPETG
jgi:GNAT superfamily N-acetyltransferase